MNTKMLDTLFRDMAEIDYSAENQKKAVELSVFIMCIHKQIREQGLGVIEDFKSAYPLLDKGLRLVRMGIEPAVVEKILHISLLSNRTELLSGLIVIEGIHAIQKGESIVVTEELLKAFLTFEFEELFEKELQKKGIPVSSDCVLSKEELSHLLQHCGK